MAATDPAVLVIGRSPIADDGTDILSGLLADCKEVMVLDVDNLAFKGALCRVVKELDEDRIKVELLINKKPLSVKADAIMRGSKRAVQLALGIKVMLPLVKWDCCSRSPHTDSTLRVMPSENDEIYEYLVHLVEDMARANPNMPPAYSTSMKEAIQTTPRRLEHDLFVVMGTVADSELFDAIEKRADACISAFRASASRG